MAGKFIQIAVAPPPNLLYALDEEGKVWSFHTGSNKWVLMIQDRA